jgi:tripeptide aminopeptidase
VRDLIDRDEILKEFIELARIDSLTFNERSMTDILKRKLEEIGIEVYEDDAGKKIEGNSGNLIGTLKGTKKVPPIILMAHMDTVTPGKNKNPIVDGDFIKTDGKTILGGDDIAGIVTILEALRIIVRERLEHGDIRVVFTVAEEGGLFGARNLDFSKIDAEYGFVFDEGGNIGTVAVSAPSQNKIDIAITGKAAHAGIEPENGISAIQIAAEAISKMKLGRIDDKTTANIGVIYGGQATNIICDSVEINAEARSRDEGLLIKQTEHMRKCFENAVKKFGGEMKYSSELVYSGFDINESDDIIKIARIAADKTGVELNPEATGGGSDTNILNAKGIKAINLSVGMQNVHCVEEQININDILKSIEFAKEIILATK